MKPRLEDWIYIHYGVEVHLPGYSFMLAVATAAGCWLFLRLIRNRSLNDRAAYSFLCLAIPFFLVGAKVGYLLQYPDSWDRGRAFWLGNGISLYGGLIAILAALACVAWRYRLLIASYLDALAVALALGLVFGRLGCFLGGCNAGTVTDLPWGVCFPRGTPMFKRQLTAGVLSDSRFLSLPVHPTQLYESALALVLFLTGLWLYRRRFFEGQVFAVLLGGYALFRFFVEFIRGDAGGIHFGYLTFAQGVSIVLLAASGVFFYLAFRQKRANKGTDSF